MNYFYTNFNFDFTFCYNSIYLKSLLFKETSNVVKVTCTEALYFPTPSSDNINVNNNNNNNHNSTFFDACDVTNVCDDFFMSQTLFDEIRDAIEV